MDRNLNNKISSGIVGVFIKVYEENSCDEHKDEIQKFNDLIQTYLCSFYLSKTPNNFVIHCL